MKSFNQYVNGIAPINESVEDKEGNPITDYHGKHVPRNKNGTLTLYHHTSPEAAAEIHKSGKWLSKENTQEIYFSNRKGEHAGNYGNSGVVKVNVHPRFVRQTDAFPSGEIYFAVHKNHLSKRHIQKDDK